jgi:virginiamycin B lyase
MTRQLTVAALAAFALAAPLAAQGGPPQPPINEWTVPWERTRPRDPYVDRQGKVWFVGQTGHYVGMLDPSTGQFRRYELDPGTGPHNLIVAPDGIVWYSGNLTGHIGRLDPATGRITKYPMPDSTIRDPHTMVFDRRGDIWFSAQSGNVVGKLTVATGAVRLVRVPTPRARPYGIMMDQQDRPWIVLFGTNKIATVDPASFVLREYTLPRPETRPRRIAITSDGAIWYGDYAAGYLGRLDPRTEQVQEWPLPGGATSRPYAVMNDDQDRVWVVEVGAQPNMFVGFDTRTRQFLPSRPVPSGGGVVRHMMFDPTSHAIWFGSDNGTIGRATLPPALTVP